jgi:hypothetical protein
MATTSADTVYRSYGPFAPDREPRPIDRHPGQAGPAGSPGMLTAFGRTPEATRIDQTRRETVSQPFRQSTEAQIRGTTRPGRPRPA